MEGGGCEEGGGGEVEVSMMRRFARCPIFFGKAAMAPTGPTVYRLSPTFKNILPDPLG